MHFLFGSVQQCSVNRQRYSPLPTSTTFWFLPTCTRHPIRNRVIVLLSAKAGLRAGEIANLTWDMVVDRKRRDR